MVPSRLESRLQPRLAAPLGQTMLIDWFTVAAQIVNFLVLVALLKRFLYGPLIHAIDAREQRIAAQVAEADQKNRSAAERLAEAQGQLAELQSKCEATLIAARDDAEHQRVEMLQKARTSVSASETKWRGEMDRERAVFLEEMRRRAASEILAVTRQALAGLASADLEHSAIEAFLAQVKQLDPSTLRSLCANDPAIATPAELSAETQQQIRDAIEIRLGSPLQLRFERAPGMPWGIELRGGGLRIGWTPDSYLDALEVKLKDALDRGTAGDYSAAA